MKTIIVLLIFAIFPQRVFSQTFEKNSLLQTWCLTSDQNRETAFAADSLVFINCTNSDVRDTLKLKPSLSFFEMKPKLFGFSFSFKTKLNNDQSLSLTDTQYGIFFIEKDFPKIIIALTPPPDFCKDPRNPDIIAKMRYKIKTLNNTKLVLQKI